MIRKEDKIQEVALRIQTQRTKEGFSLIEVGTALAILVLILGGALAVFSQGFNIIDKSKKRTVAYNLAKEAMEEYSDWSSLPGNGNYTNPSPYPAIINGVTYNVDLRISDGPIRPFELKQIDVTVSWGAESFTLTALKANY